MKEAQEHLSAKPEMVIKAFKVTGISLALDGSENSLFRSDSCLELPNDKQTESDIGDGDDPFKDLDEEYDSELEE